jgi:hypothetical protein
MGSVLTDRSASLKVQPKSRSQKLVAAGFERRPRPRLLPSDDCEEALFGDEVAKSGDVLSGRQFTWQQTRTTDEWNFANLSHRESVGQLLLGYNAVFDQLHLAPFSTAKAPKHQGGQQRQVGHNPKHGANFT